MNNKRPVVLSIAGFDPSGGAGILADIKTFEMNHVYGLGVCSSVTYQNESEFDGVDWMSFDSMQRQLEVLFRRHIINVIKIGLIGDLQVLNSLLDYLKEQNVNAKIIWDPILKASAGFDFHNTVNQDLLSEILCKLYLVTPNMPEAIRLAAVSENPMVSAIALHKYVNVYLKGGHGTGSDADDLLLTSEGYHRIEGRRIEHGEKHGSGCVLSAAIAANLAREVSLPLACRNARKYINQFLQSNVTLLGYHHEQSNTVS